MDLKRHYQRLTDNAKGKIKEDGVQFDPLIDNSADDRRGITLLLRPGAKLVSSFAKVASSMDDLFPGHHVYPGSDMHVTVMPIVSCYPGYRLSEALVPEYVEVIRRAVSGLPPISIQFKGLCMSSDSLMVCGYPLTNALETLRDNLRREFSLSPLEQSLDKRYKLITAHVTLFRLKHSRFNVEDYLSLIQNLEFTSFGNQLFTQTHLVFNDWYQRRPYVEDLESFDFT